VPTASAISVKLSSLLHDISSVYRLIFQHEGDDFMRALTSTCEFLFCDYKYTIAKICASRKNYTYEKN